MPATIERFSSVPQFRPFLRERLCGTDGRGLKFPLPPSVSVEPGTDMERTGTDGAGVAVSADLFGLERQGPLAVALVHQTTDTWRGVEWTADTTVQAWAAVAREGLPQLPADTD
jgi:hypothetical protein